jgi:hypothetical protein
MNGSMEEWKIGLELEQLCELALSLGQDPEVIRKVKAKETHPIVLL